jgi:hypothetical protein
VRRTTRGRLLALEGELTKQPSEADRRVPFDGNSGVWPLLAVPIRHDQAGSRQERSCLLRTVMRLTRRHEQRNVVR